MVCRLAFRCWILCDFCFLNGLDVGWELRNGRLDGVLVALLADLPVVVASSPGVITEIGQRDGF